MDPSYNNTFVMPSKNKAMLMGNTYDDEGGTDCCIYEWKQGTRLLSIVFIQPLLFFIHFLPFPLKLFQFCFFLAKGILFVIQFPLQA